MTPLQTLLDTYRAMSQSEREKGTYFELLVRQYLLNEPAYKAIYAEAWMFSDWARANGQDARDTGIDLIARTHKGELHAVQCKLYADTHTLIRNDVLSFIAASGRLWCAGRVFVSVARELHPNAML
jgi:predicted helicase